MQHQHCLSVFIVMYLLWGLQMYSDAQYSADPSMTFEIMTFDQVLRGSYNSTTCIKEFMNCMEVIKPDLICLDGRLQNSICAHIRDKCSQMDGHHFDNKLFIYESKCESDEAT